MKSRVVPVDWKRGRICRAHQPRLPPGSIRVFTEELYGNAKRLLQSLREQRLIKHAVGYGVNSVHGQNVAECLRS